MAAVGFDQVSLRYPGTDRPALDHLDLDIDDGEFVVLVGPSGCGKTTALRVLAGLQAPDAGRVRIGERDVTDVEPGDRDVAMVFQNYALYPHMTVGQNLAFALKIARTPRPEIRRRVAATAELLGLEPYLSRRPKDLSGGQRQRVAMGRAIVRRPQVFLMDEPLSNLDATLRLQTRTQIVELQRQLGTTTVYVTHDQVEAMTMGDRVAVLRDGVLQQVAPPRELYRRPANVFVAGFIGSPAMNFFTVPVIDGAAWLGGQRIVLPEPGAAEPVLIGVRPEHLHPADRGLDFEVDFVEELGADSYLYGRVTGPQRVSAAQSVTVRRPGDSRARRGDRLRLRPDPEQLHVFTLDGRRVERAEASRG